MRSTLDTRAGYGGNVAFSERMGHRSARSALQVDSIDEPLRTAVFNLMHQLVVEQWYDGRDYGYGYAVGRLVWTDFWRQRADQFDNSRFEFADVLNRYLMTCPWYEVYDLIEFCVENASFDSAAFNQVLARDMAGYRVIDGLVVPVSDEIEIGAIDGALAAPDKFAGARQHIQDALSKLAQRPSPDLRNAITEAVSAVESAARIVSGNRRATLGDAIKVLDKSGHLHPALRDAWLKLYGYTSDEHGLRHAMLEDPEIDFATAKYMVVSCAAFVNLLVAQAGLRPASA